MLIISTGPTNPGQQQSADSGDLAWIAPPVHSRKSQIDATLKIIPLPANETILTRTHSPQLIEDEKAEQAAKVWKVLLMQVVD